MLRLGLEYLADLIEAPLRLIECRDAREVLSRVDLGRDARHIHSCNDPICRCFEHVCIFPSERGRSRWMRNAETLDDGLQVYVVDDGLVGSRSPPGLGNFVQERLARRPP